MTSDRQLLRDDLEAHLRTALRARVDDAPMPPGVLDVPDRSVRPPRRGFVGAVALAMASAVAAVLAAGVLVQLPQLGRSMQQLGAERAAAFVGVPVDHVVETRDGVIAASLQEAPLMMMQIFLVVSGPDGPQSELLAQVPGPATILDDDSSTIWADVISCSPERGLQQPNIVVTGSNPEPLAVVRGVPAQMITFDSYAVAVLEASLVGEAGVFVDDGHVGFTLPGWMFDRADACNGEVIPPH